MKKLNMACSINHGSQRGIALMIGLVFLLLMTLIGLYLSRSSSLELRMAGNAGAKAVSFEQAEDARMDAESALLPIVDNVLSAGDFDCNTLGTGHYARAGEGSSCTALTPEALSWDGSDSIVSASYSDRRYAIEYLGRDQVYEEGDDVETGTGGPRKIYVYLFRVVGHGLELSGSESTVETFFIVRDPNPVPNV